MSPRSPSAMGAITAQPGRVYMGNGIRDKLQPQPITTHTYHLATASQNSQPHRPEKSCIENRIDYALLHCITHTEMNTQTLSWTASFTTEPAIYNELSHISATASHLRNAPPQNRGVAGSNAATRNTMSQYAAQFLPAEQCIGTQRQ